MTKEELAKKIIEVGRKRCSGHVLILDEATLLEMLGELKP